MRRTKDRGQTGFSLIAMGIMVSLLAAGCAKKVETAQQSVSPPEERVTPETPASPEEPMREQSPNVKESEMTPPGTSTPGLSTSLEMIHFDYDKATIRPDAKAILEKHAKWLQANPKAKIQIEGHTDERGTNEYNLALGERRAEATKRFLTAMGIDARRLSVISYGEERPLCIQHDESCYGKNRRAQFIIEK